MLVSDIGGEHLFVGEAVCRLKALGARLKGAHAILGSRSLLCAVHCDSEVGAWVVRQWESEGR